MGMPYFSKLKTIIHELISVKNVFKPATTNNENGAVAMREILCGSNESNISINLKKVQQRVIKELLKCALMLLFYFIKLN